jgi:hyperosmotically inducible periplasmic protein
MRRISVAHFVRKTSAARKYMSNPISVFATAALICGAVTFGTQSAFADDSQHVDRAAATGTSKDADNSKVNQRDRAENALTADDQTSGGADMEITQKIRQALVKDKKLSTYAHNLKIVTVGGVVTLKGPVKSAAEKRKSEQIAKAVAGVGRVDNQLSIKR